MWIWDLGWGKQKERCHQWRAEEYNPSLLRTLQDVVRRVVGSKVIKVLKNSPREWDLVWNGVGIH